MGDYTDQKTPTNHAVLRTEIVEVTKEKNELSIARDVVNKMPECNLRISLQNRLDTVDINLNEDVNKNFKKIYSSYTATFGIKDDGTLWAWGENYCGSLGQGNDDSSISVPVKINAFNGVDIVDVKSGYANSMALASNGDVYVWGWNKEGTLGLGDMENKLTPQKINLRGSAIEIKIGFDAFIVKYSDGYYDVWGDNSEHNYNFVSLDKIITSPTLTSEPYDDIVPGCYATFLINGSNINVLGTNKYGTLGLGDNADRVNVVVFNDFIKTASSNLDIYIKTENMLLVSLSTNSITFEDYSGVEDLELIDALEMKINSSIPYNINAYLESEIQNSDKTLTVDKSLFNLKENRSDEYKEFTDIQTKLALSENNSAGNDKIHIFDFKLKGGLSHKADIYKTVVKFEVEQK